MNASKYCQLVLAALVIASLSQIAHAQGGSPHASGGKKGKAADAPAPAPAVPVPAGPTGMPKADDKVDISDLENKYWAPKDTDFSVVQNRTYSKAGRFLLTPVWGMPINDPYSEGNLFGVVGNYFWSERMGVQLTYIKANLHNNSATDDFGALSATSGATPNHGRITSTWDIGYNIVPFYAKMSFWGTRIIYFDMAFTPHVGMTQNEQLVESGNQKENAFTYGLDVSQMFFFTKSFAVRVDLKNQWRHEDVLIYRSTGMGEKIQDKTRHDTLFLIGPTFYW